MYVGIFIYVFIFGYFAIRIKAKSFSFKRHFFQTRKLKLTELKTESSMIADAQLCLKTEVYDP